MLRVTLGTSRWTSALAAMLLGGASSAAAQASRDVVQYPNPTSVKTVPASAIRLDVGGDGKVEFHRISAIVPLRSGAFLMANGSTNELRFFDAAGQLRSTVGRKGQGPGEYAEIREVVLLPSDSLVVLDRLARRVSILNPQGAFVRSFALAAPFEGGGSTTRIVALRNGTILIGYSEITRMAPQPTAVYFGQRLFAYSSGGALQAVAGVSLPESERFIQATTPQMGGVAYWDLAFARTMTVKADSNALLVGDGTEWTLDVRSTDGKVIRTHRLDRATVPLTTADKDAYRDVTIGGSKDAQKAMAERMVAEMPFPIRRPVGTAGLVQSP